MVAVVVAVVAVAVVAVAVVAVAVVAAVFFVGLSHPPACRDFLEGCRWEGMGVAASVAAVVAVVVLAMVPCSQRLSVWAG